MEVLDAILTWIIKIVAILVVLWATIRWFLASTEDGFDVRGFLALVLAYGFFLGVILQTIALQPLAVVWLTVAFGAGVVAYAFSALAER